VTDHGPSDSNTAPPGRAAVFDHIALAVKSIRSSLALFDVVFDHRLVYGTDDDERHIRTIQFVVAGRSKIELMEPTSEDSPLASHIEARGEGFHHLTLKTGDLGDTIDRLATNGVETIGTDYSNPAWMETYTRPSACHGVLVQIAQTNRDWLEPLPGLTVDDVLAGRLVWTGSSVEWRDPARGSGTPWPPFAR
jgi:methylmalonyl-CoA/ethylmalonyl-CoA epimerase